MHDWIKKRLREIGKKQNDLAAALGLPHTRVSEIISGKRTVRAHEAAILSNFLGLSGDEVLNRFSIDGVDDEFIVVRPPVVHVPLISWVQAGELAEISDPLPPGAADEWVAVDSMKATLIALRVRGTSINRVAPDGSAIIVDYADTDPISGKLYAFKTGDGTGSVKRYKSDPPRFEPDSTEPHETIFPDEHTQIIGRVEKVIVDV